MGVEVERKTERVQGTLWRVDFQTFGRITVALPLFSLVFCFLTAIIFKFDEVNKTVCQVSNRTVIRVSKMFDECVPCIFVPKSSLDIRRMLIYKKCLDLLVYLHDVL